MFIMDPRNIASSPLDEEFDASDAFLIGILAENKMNRMKSAQGLNKNYNATNLRLVK